MHACVHGHVDGNVRLIHPLFQFARGYKMTRRMFLEFFLNQNKVVLNDDVRKRHEDELAMMLKEKTN